MAATTANEKPPFCLLSSLLTRSCEIQYRNFSYTSFNECHISTFNMFTLKCHGYCIFGMQLIMWAQMRCKWTSKDRIAMEKQSNSLLKKNTAAFKRCIRPNVWIKIKSTNQLLSKLIVLLNGRVPLLCQLWNQSRCLHRKIGIRCLIQGMQIQCRTGPHWLLCEK